MFTRIALSSFWKSYTEGKVGKVMGISLLEHATKDRI
jgi:hypothetical protein